MTGVDKLEDEVSKLATNINQAYERLLSLERYSRDLNLRFHNIPQDSNENCTEQLKKRPYYLMIWTCIKPVIENGHRIGGPRTSASNDPRPVIAKFIYRLERLKVIQKKRSLKNDSPWARKWNPPPTPRGLLQTFIISKLHPRVFEKCMFALDWLVGVVVQQNFFPQQRVTGYPHQEVS